MQKESGAADLDFQLVALRKRLAGLDEEAAEAREAVKEHLRVNGEERQRLEERLVVISQELTGVLSTHPELADLFARLRQA